MLADPNIHGFVGGNGGIPDKLFLPANLFWKDYGTPDSSEYIPVGAGATTALPCWNFVDNAIEQVHTNVIVPSDYSNIAFEVIYAMATATSGNVVHRLKVQPMAIGDRAEVQSAVNKQTYAVPGTSLTIVKQALTNTAPFATDDIVGVGYGRAGSDGADNASGYLQFLGMLLTFS